MRLNGVLKKIVPDRDAKCCLTERRLKSHLK